MGLGPCLCLGPVWTFLHNVFEFSLNVFIEFAEFAKLSVEYWIRFEWNKHRCTDVHYEEFILVDVVLLLYKWNEILNGIYIGLYANIWIDWRTYENDSQMYWSE